VSKKGVAVFFGAIDLVINGVKKRLPRALVIDFGDTHALQQAANSGFGEFDFPDDDIAVVLDGKPPPG
jgi:hypothetical protein